MAEKMSIVARKPVFQAFQFRSGTNQSAQHSLEIFEPRCEKTGLRGFRPGPTQTGLHNHRRCQEA